MIPPLLLSLFSVGSLGVEELRVEVYAILASGALRIGKFMTATKEWTT